VLEPPSAVADPDIAFGVLTHELERPEPRW
jgi:hypothetical protein